MIFIRLYDAEYVLSTLILKIFSKFIIFILH